MLPSEYLEKGWTQRADAKDCNGNDIGVSHEKAAAWCIYGAILASESSNTLCHNTIQKLCTQINKILDEIYDGIYSFADFNDAPARTKEEIIAVLKQAEQELELNNVT